MLLTPVSLFVLLLSLLSISHQLIVCAHPVLSSLLVTILTRANSFP